MKYFDGLNFVAWGAFPQYDYFISRGCRQPGGTSSEARVLEFSDYGLQFNYAGKFTYAVGNRRPRMYEGAYAWFTMPQEKCRYGSPAGDTRNHRHVNFSGPRVQRFFAEELIDSTPSTVPVPITRPDRFARQFDELLESLTQQRYPYAAHLLEGLLFAMQVQPPAAGDHLTPRIRKLAMDISDAPGKAWEFGEEARKLCVSYDHFRRMFKRTIQLAPGKYLMGCRLQLAAELLRETSDTVIEIAERVGIEDLHYFTRLFSRQYQMPPVKYRHRLKSISCPDAHPATPAEV